MIYMQAEKLPNWNESCPQMLQLCQRCQVKKGSGRVFRCDLMIYNQDAIFCMSWAYVYIFVRYLYQHATAALTHRYSTWLD